MAVPAISSVMSPAAGGVGPYGASGLSTAGGAAQAAAPGQDFGATLAQFISGAASNVKAGEATAIAGMQDKASTQQVVEAVISADQSLQIAMAIRDKVVSAYLEISRMSI